MIQLQNTFQEPLEIITVQRRVVRCEVPTDNLTKSKILKFENPKVAGRTDRLRQGFGGHTTQYPWDGVNDQNVTPMEGFGNPQSVGFNI